MSCAEVGTSWGPCDNVESGLALFKENNDKDRPFKQVYIYINIYIVYLKYLATNIPDSIYQIWCLWKVSDVCCSLLLSHNTNFDDWHLIDVDVNEDVDVQLSVKCWNVKVEIKVEIKLNGLQAMWGNQSPDLVIWNDTYL